MSLLYFYHSWHKIFALIIIQADATLLKNEYTSQSRLLHLLKILPYICLFHYIFSPVLSTTGIWYSVPLFNILHSGYNQLVGIFIDCSCSFIHHTNSNNSSTFPSSILIVTFCLLKCTPPYTDGASSIEKLHQTQDF